MGATLDCTTDMPDTTPDTPMPTTARGPLMLSPRPRLTPGILTVPTVHILMPTVHTDTTDTPMPTTDTTATPDLTDTVTDILATEDTTGDKSQYLKVPSFWKCLQPKDTRSKFDIFFT